MDNVVISSMWLPGPNVYQGYVVTRDVWLLWVCGCYEYVVTRITGYYGYVVTMGMWLLWVCGY